MWTTARTVHAKAVGNCGVNRPEPGQDRLWTVDNAAVRCPQLGLIKSRQGLTYTRGPTVRRSVFSRPAALAESTLPAAAFTQTT